MDDDEFEAMLKEADLNGDRLIDFDEFVQVRSDPTKGAVAHMEVHALLSDVGPG